MKSKSATNETKEEAQASKLERMPLNIDALRRKLKKAGATLDETTIQKWGRQGIIPASTLQESEKGKVGHRKKAGNKGGRRALYPPEAFEDAAAAFCVVEAARKRRERIPTVGTIRKTMVYADQVLHAYVTDYHLARALKHWEYTPHPQKLPDHLAENEIAHRLFKSSKTSGNEVGLVEDMVLISSEYQPHIVSYICGSVKAVNDYDLRTPIIVSFIWKSPDTPPELSEDIVVEDSPFCYDCLNLVNIEAGYGDITCSVAPQYLVARSEFCRDVKSE
ncbi:MAG: hypothetical protein ACXV2E_04265 [Halobacteriota archaeon]